MSKKQHQQQISILRPDGRIGNNTLRPLSCELECLHNCDGSSIWKSGSTNILVAIHGPIAPRLVHHEVSNTCIVSVVIKSGNSNANAVGTSSSTSYEREWEKFVSIQLSSCIIMEQYPRSVISIIVQILNADGSVLGSVLQACVVALMDASIAMKYIPTAITCCVINNSNNNNNNDNSNQGSNNNATIQDEIRLDPSSEEERDAKAVLVLVLSNQSTTATTSATNMNANDDESEEGGKVATLCGCHSTTASMKISPTKVLACWSSASRAVPAIQAFVRLAVEQKVVRESQTLWST